MNFSIVGMSENKDMAAGPMATTIAGCNIGTTGRLKNAMTKERPKHAPELLIIFIIFVKNMYQKATSER